MKRNLQARTEQIIAMLCVVLLLSACGTDSAEAYSKEGLEYYEAGEYESAAQSFMTAIEKDEGCADYYLYLCYALAAQGDIAGAASACQNALALSEDDPAVWRALGITSYLAADYETAAEYFTQALDLSEGVEDAAGTISDLYLYRAASYGYLGEYESAIADYTALLETADSQNAQAYFGRGCAYARIGDGTQALEDLKACVELAPYELGYYVEGYLTLTECGYNIAAAKLLSLAPDPDTEADAVYTAAILYYSGEYGAAAEYILECGTELADALMFLGLAYEALGVYDEALEVYEGLLGAVEADSALYYRMALCYEAQGEYEIALEYVGLGLEADDASNAELLYLEAACYEYMSDFAAALEKLQEYADIYGTSDDIEHEIAFLETRI